MTVPKLRAAIVALVVGLALGLSVFAASRLFVRAVLGGEAVSAARELSERLADGQDPAAERLPSPIVSFAFIGNDGARRAGAATPDRAVSESTAGGAATVAEAPLWRILLGLDQPTPRSVIVPVAEEGRTLGSLYAEFDQSASAAALGRTFSAFAWVVIGLAVLATLALMAAVTHSRRRKKAFDPAAMPRDPLTGLPTRTGFSEALADAVARARKADHQIGLLIVELDDFGKVNEVWGHAAGDAVLKGTAERLGRFAEAPASLARISGDAFALVVERDATSHSLRHLAENIREALLEPHAVGASSIVLGPCFGAALFPVNAEDSDALFRAADTALRYAKSDGRTGLAFFDTEMEKRIGRRAALERDIKRALESEEFVVFYQPQLELASGQRRGYEALLRWERPGEGILPPGEFLPVAQETGLIRPLGDWVLRTACRDAATWLDSGTVAVNISAEQFRFQDLPDSIAKALSESGLPAERLEIEVPESLFLQRSPEVMDQLQRIKALGVRVAMDNFGAGYTGLASLAQFHFDKVKVDRTFVGQLTEDASVAAIVASVVGLGRSLSVDITAEGVETDEQVKLLRAAGCSIVQGFLFGMPSRDKPTAAAAGEAAAQTQQDAAAESTG
jgi:diguanylate cyclase (GGDEF)-like protein